MNKQDHLHAVWLLQDLLAAHSRYEATLDKQEFRIKAKRILDATDLLQKLVLYHRAHMNASSAQDVHSGEATTGA